MLGRSLETAGIQTIAGRSLHLRNNPRSFTPNAPHPDASCDITCARAIVTCWQVARYFKMGVILRQGGKRDQAALSLGGTSSTGLYGGSALELVNKSAKTVPRWWMIYRQRSPERTKFLIREISSYDIENCATFHTESTLST